MSFMKVVRKRGVTTVQKGKNGTGAGRDLSGRGLGEESWEFCKGT
ncbi:hypothetical protein I3843_07G204000 [Carya illinoinensis]|nr:hypothetical protein I3843_07G204000 [Carya illinoinensis]